MNFSFPLKNLITGIFSCTLICCLAGCSGSGSERDKAIKDRKAQITALTLIKNDDCLNCHSIEDKSVGPSYVRIAQRYETDFPTIDRLADKIITGGGGLWGGALMTEHPLLKKENAKKIVRWILSLDDSVSNRDPMISTTGVLLSDAFQRSAQKKENGLFIKAYALGELEYFGTGDFPEIPDHVAPIDSGVVRSLHFPGERYFESLKTDFYLRATGFITIKHRGKYFFKQVKAGKGRVMINGSTIINENDWDTEVDKDLAPGTYPITVEYIAGLEDNALSLQWITPKSEYYQVIPEEVFTYK